MAIKLALLLCDTPVPPVKQKYGTYREVFETLLDESRPSQDVSFTLDGFDVVSEQVYPNLDDGGYKAILLSGSGECYVVTLPNGAHRQMQLLLRMRISHG